MGPVCGKCGELMTPQNSRIRPELFLHDECLPAELKPQPLNSADFKHLVGRICITPFEKPGLVFVREVYHHGSDWMAEGIFIGDHAGYSNASLARYYAKELRPTWLEISTMRDGMFAGRIREPNTTQHS